MTDNKYQNGKIYKITGTDDSMVYIGSTIRTLGQRFKNHLSDYRRWKNGKYHNITAFELFEKFGVENCNMVLVEKFPCNDKESLERREGHHIKITNGCVNIMVAGRSRKEYADDNKDSITNYQKTYYETNGEKIRENGIANYKKNQKQKLEYAKRYKEENKEKIQKIKTEQLICECGCVSARNNMWRHRQTQQHMHIMHGKTACKLCKVNCNYEEHKKLTEHKFNLIEWLCA